MKIKYDRDADILTMEFSDEGIDHAEEAGPLIIHLTDDNKPVLIEILDASEFLAAQPRSVLNRCDLIYKICRTQNWQFDPHI
jgi:uncharacterized protein YuzE